MDRTKMESWLIILELNGSVDEDRTVIIGLGIFTVAGHHYFRVPSISAGCARDPALSLIEDASGVGGALAIPAIPLSNTFESDEGVAASAVA
jgi:hypothetical protein